jgi:MYXO-CTERM domain-containing protein
MPYLHTYPRLSSAIACILACLVPAVGHAEVVIVEPSNGAVVDPDFTVKITYTDQFFGDTDFEGDLEPDEFEIRVDGMVEVSCLETCQNNNTAEFQLSLAPGQHELEAMARVSFGFSEEHSEPITITVKGESDTTGDPTNSSSASDTTDTTGDTAATGDVPTSGAATDDTGSDPADTDATTTTEPPADPDDKAGCACDAGSGPGSALPWLVVVGLPLLRRRRPARQHRP